jgi:2-polyprenyl-3-methyl-5-hydroxy-6-metoxy-1,4-benzoquinol methylase
LWQRQGSKYAGGGISQSSFLGLDLCEEPILKARKEADEKGNTNTWFEIMDLTTYSSDSKYDLITAFDVIHDQARPDKVLKMVMMHLKEDGVFLMQDIDGSSNLSENKNHPLGSMLYSISTMHCMTVSLAQGGMGLGTMWGVDTAEKMLREAGFTKIKVHRLEHDVQNAYFVKSKKIRRINKMKTKYFILLNLITNLNYGNIFLPGNNMQNTVICLHGEPVISWGAGNLVRQDLIFSPMIHRDFSPCIFC